MIIAAIAVIVVVIVVNIIVAARSPKWVDIEAIVGLLWPAVLTRVCVVFGGITDAHLVPFSIATKTIDVLADILFTDGIGTSRRRCDFEAGVCCCVNVNVNVSDVVIVFYFLRGYPFRETGQYKKGNGENVMR